MEPRPPPDGRLISPAPAVRIDADGRPVVPREIDPELVEAARWLGKAVEFIVIPCNAAHVGVHAIREAAGCPVLSMIDVTIDEVVRRRCRRIGVMGFAGAPAGYLEPMGQRGIGCAEIPLLLDRDDVTDLINPASLLAEAAVRYATDE